MNRRILISLVVVLLGLSASPNLVGADEAKNLDELIEELITSNPELASANYLTKASKKMIPQASSLEDPRFFFEASNIPVDNPSLTSMEMSGFRFGLMQMVPFPGKRSLMKGMAKIEHDQTLQEFEEKKNQLIAKFKMTFYDYAETLELESLYEKAQAQLGSLKKATESKYASDMMMDQSEILEVKMEITMTKEKLIELREMKKILEQRLIAYLNRPSESSLKIKRPAKKLKTVTVEVEALMEVAILDRPWVKRNFLEVEKMKKEKNLAKMDLLPDFDFSAEYHLRDNNFTDPMNREDLFSAGVTINIPLWGITKQSKKISEKKYRYLEATKNYEATQKEVTFEIQKAFHEIKSANQTYHLITGELIPQAQAFLATTKRNYEAGSSSYGDVIKQEVALINAQVMAVESFYEFYRKLAELQMALGKEVESL